MFVVMLDGTTVNVGLPSIGRSFGTGTAGLQWVVDGYLLVLACGLLSAGAAGRPDRAAHTTNAASPLLIHTSHLGYAIGAGATAIAGLIALIALTEPFHETSG